jgi:hypothetical protein
VKGTGLREGEKHGHDKTKKRWFRKMNRALAAAGQPAHMGTCASCGWGGATWGMGWGALGRAGLVAWAWA